MGSRAASGHATGEREQFLLVARSLCGPTHGPDHGEVVRTCAIGPGNCWGISVDKPAVISTGADLISIVAGVRPSRLAVRVMVPGVAIERMATRLIPHSVSKSTPGKDFACVRRCYYTHRVKASDGRWKYPADSAQWVSRARAFSVVESVQWRRSVVAPLLASAMGANEPVATNSPDGHPGTGRMIYPRTALRYQRQPATKYSRRRVNP